MKNKTCKTLFILILFVGLSNVFGQTNQYSDTSFYDSDGAIRHIRYFSNSKPDSIDYFDQNGKKTETYIYKGNGRDRWTIKYYVRKEEAPYYSSNDFKTGDGTILSYHENGNIEVEAFFRNGHVEGKAVKYYKDGKIKSQEEFKKGKWSGPYTEYYENGNVWHKGQYHKNKLYGDIISFYPNGKLLWEGKYDKGRMSGVRLAYDSTGNLCNGPLIAKDDSGIVWLEGKCINGKPEGEFKVYYEGKLYIKDNYKQGLPDGLAYYYDPKGEVYLTELYKSGKFVKEIKGKKENGKEK